MEPETPATGKGPVGSFTIALLVVGLLAITLTVVLRQSIQTKPTTAATAGQRAPEIQVAGWLNGPGPTAEELHGKVIVLDAWAYWCGPCRASAPELIKLYEKYHNRVVFLGLTEEGIDADPYNRRFLEVTKITWPNGYGAVKTLTELNPEYIPWRWVIDRQYNLVWNEKSPESIETAIDRALAEQP